MAKGIDPAKRKASYAVEGVTEVQPTRYIPFQGGMDIAREIYQLPLAGYSDIQNMRPLRPGFIKRKGCAVLHTTADGTNGVTTMAQFSKGKSANVKTYAQMSDGDIVEFTNNPPEVTTGALGSTVHTSDDPSTMKPASWAIIRDMLIYADSTGKPYFYPGTTAEIISVVVYKGTATIPVIPILGEDYSNDIRDTLASTYADFSSLSTLAAYDAVFIRTECIADALNFTLFAANTTASVFQLHYWNGAWTAASGFSDGTSSSGRGLAQNGTMSWTMPTDCIPNYLFGQNGFWIRLSLASGAMGANVKISNITYESDFMEMQNVWDGVPQGMLEAYYYEADTDTYQYYAATSITLDAMKSTDKLYVNAISPSIALYFNPGAVPNEETATMTVKYRNGTTFTEVSSASDGTSVTGKSLAQPGWVTFSHPTDEHKTVIQSSIYYSYWYEITFDADLTTEMSLSVELMPWYDISDHGTFYNACPWKNRVSYACSELPGYVIVSAKDLPMCLNGSDYFIKDVGDGRLNKVVAQAQFRNELMVWQEEKGVDGGCLTLLEGYDPLTIGKLLLSSRFGTFSQKSVCVVDEDVLNVNRQSPDQEYTIKTAAFFLSRYGFCMSDGRGGVSLLSSSDITPYFDPTDSRCIRRGYEDEHWIAQDPTYQIIRIGLVSGTIATKPNIFLVYDYKTGAFSHDELTYPLSCMAVCESSSGQSPTINIGGGTADGTVYLLDTGTNDVSTAIDAYVVMEFDGHGHELHLEELILRHSGSCTIYTYEDGVTGTLDKTIAVT